jgi:hypothetical protein
LRDAVARFAADLETVSMKGEDLSGIGNGLRLVDDKACDGGGLFVGQVPVGRAIEVADLAWWSSAELDPALFPAADVGVLEKVRARLGQSLIAST